MSREGGWTSCPQALQARTPCLWRVPWRPSTQPLEGPLSLRLVNIRSILIPPPAAMHSGAQTGAQTWQLPLVLVPFHPAAAPTSPILQVPDFLHGFPAWPEPPVRSVSPSPSASAPSGHRAGMSGLWRVSAVSLPPGWGTRKLGLGPCFSGGPAPWTDRAWARVGAGTSDCWNLLPLNRRLVDQAQCKGFGEAAAQRGAGTCQGHTAS